MIHLILTTGTIVLQEALSVTAHLHLGAIRLHGDAPAEYAGHNSSAGMSIFQ